VFDRQFLSSLLGFLAAAAAFLGILFVLAWRTGAAGFLVLAGTVGGILCWFYRGRRPDMPPKGRPDGRGPGA